MNFNIRGIDLKSSTTIRYLTAYYTERGAINVRSISTLKNNINLKTNYLQVLN